MYVYVGMYGEYRRTAPTHAANFALYAIFPRQREKGLKSAYGVGRTPPESRTHTHTHAHRER